MWHFKAANLELAVVHPGLGARRRLHRIFASVDC